MQAQGELARCGQPAYRDGVPSASRSRTPSLALASAATVLAALRVGLAPGGPTSWDEANGCLGVVDFDVLQHRPHPPGYPLWMAAGRALESVLAPHAALVVLAALASSFALWPMWRLARATAPPGIHRGRFAWAAALLYALNPIAWSFGMRALSGAFGLLLAPGLVLLLLRARGGDRRALGWASLGLGLAGGFRQELLVFLLPLWFVCWRPLRGITAPLLAAAGAACWMVPLVISCGGLGAYLGSTDYMEQILAAESLLFGGSTERAAATLHRVLAALVLGLGPVALLGLWRSRVVPTRSVLLWSAVPCLLFCTLGYFHKKAYLATALPALTILGLAPWWSSPRGRRVAFAQVALWAGLFFALPNAEAVYRRDDGWLVPHRDVGFPARLAYPWLEDGNATIRARDARRAAVHHEIRHRLAEHPDLWVWIEPGARFSMREAMWAAPMAHVLEAPRAEQGGEHPVLPATRGHAGSWAKVAPEAPRNLVEGRPVLWLPASPVDPGPGWGAVSITAWTTAFWRSGG